MGRTLRSPDNKFVLRLDTYGGAPHPRLTVVNDAAGDTLAVVKDACCPRFSPDSRMLAILRWNVADSNQVLSLLRLGDKSTPRVILPGTSVVDYEWSPDSRLLAAHAHPRTSASVTLYVVQAESWIVNPIDSIAIALDYEFAWSPTSEWLAALRPVGETGEEESDSELLLHNSSTGKTFGVSYETLFGIVRPRWVADSVVVCPTASFDQDIEVIIGAP
jgi:hypothetical protein